MKIFVKYEKIFERVSKIKIKPNPIHFHNTCFYQARFLVKHNNQDN